MRIHRLASILFVSTFAFLVGCNTENQPQTQSTTSKAALGDLAQRTVERRAVEAVIWGMPAVNFDRMYQAMVHDANAGVGSNKVVFWH